PPHSALPRPPPPPPPPLPYTTLFRSNCSFTIFTAAVSFPQIWFVLRAVPIRNLSLTASLREGSFTSFSFLCDEQLKIANAMQRRSEEHTSELQSRENLVCRLLLEQET